MAYEGELLEYCWANLLDWSHTAAVIVSGDGINHWGHMLLCVGQGDKALYFQVAGVYTVPRFLTAQGYGRYLHESGKHEIRRFDVSIPNPAASQRALELALSQPRSWWAVVHNCESFAEDIIVAGGGPKIHRGPIYLPTWSKAQGR